MFANGKKGCSHGLGLASDGEEKLEFWGELVLGVQAVGEVDSANTAVSVDLNSTQIISKLTTVSTCRLIRRSTNLFEHSFRIF